MKNYDFTQEPLLFAVHARNEVHAVEVDRWRGPLRDHTLLREVDPKKVCGTSIRSAGTR